METFVTTMPVDLEVRDAGNGAHELEGICVPYNVPTMKAGPSPEIIRPGAFASAVRVPEKIKLYGNNHDRKARPLGKAQDLEERADGLYGRFRFFKTTGANDAYEEIRDGGYGGLSIGFVAKKHRQTATGREVLEAHLHHVSLVDDPAYEGAELLAVRHAEPRDYAFFRTAPTITIALSEDTPLMVEFRRRF